ncbi:hypothetical protein WKI68_06180 [Streptomyces sp. MS1.HAVA.3]|uniref:Uncharacterized protein n=1 Tax=Streptomyces caledonius TaxID=3134107 RepID=A0ABU8TZY0_9ACTN
MRSDHPPAVKPRPSAVIGPSRLLDLPDGTELWAGPPGQLLAAAQTRALTAAYLHILISNCPTDAHAPAYAQMVRSGHARRLLRRHAGLLSQAARAPGPDPAGTVLARADQLAVYLDELATAFPSPRVDAPNPGGTRPGSRGAGGGRRRGTDAAGRSDRPP